MSRCRRNDVSAWRGTSTGDSQWAARAKAPNERSCHISRNAVTIVSLLRPFCAGRPDARCHATVPDTLGEFHASGQSPGSGGAIIMPGSMQRMCCIADRAGSDERRNLQIPSFRNNRAKAALVCLKGILTVIGAQCLCCLASRALR